jgi:hypothetical protein
MKKAKKSKEWHAPNTKFGMGDNYGTGIKNPMGRMREGIGMYPVSKKELGTPPKSLA